MPTTPGPLLAPLDATGSVGITEYRIQRTHHDRPDYIAEYWAVSRNHDHIHAELAGWLSKSDGFTYELLERIVIVDAGPWTASAR